MSLDSFEQKSIQTEQERIDIVKNQLNKNFSGVVLSDEVGNYSFSLVKVAG